MGAATFEGIPSEGHDQLLALLCGRKTIDTSVYEEEAECL